MINLYKPYMPENLPEINSILQSGKLAYGEWGKKFEESLRNYVGCEERVLVTNSFTSAIQVVLSTLDIQLGDEIIASPQSCLASTQPLVTFGAKVKWADIDPTKGTLSPDSVEKKITARTKIIFHNHHCGYPGYIDEINALGKKYGIWVIDDCIEAFGAEYKGKILGNTGTDITLFSFQTVRLPNTIDGGGIIFKDKNLYEKAIKVRDLGVDRKSFRDSLGEINPSSDVSIHGFGVTMNEVSGYIGYCQMSDLRSLIAQQRTNAKKWQQEIISDFPTIQYIKNIDSLPNYWVFGVLANNKLETIKYFRNRCFYASGVHIPNTHYSVFLKQEELPGVQEFSSKFLALPCGWWFEK